VSTLAQLSRQHNRAIYGDQLAAQITGSVLSALMKTSSACPCHLKAAHANLHVGTEHCIHLAVHDVQLRELPMPDGGNDARRTREGDLQDNVFRYALAAESYEVHPWDPQNSSCSCAHDSLSNRPPPCTAPQQLAHACNIASPMSIFVAALGRTLSHLSVKQAPNPTLNITPTLI